MCFFSCNVTTISCFKKFDANECKRNCTLQPWADWNTSTSDSEDDSKTHQSEEDESSNENEFLTAFKSNLVGDAMTITMLSSSTVRDCKEHYNLKIGSYVQEFAIDDAATDLIVNHVNSIFFGRSY